MHLRFQRYRELQQTHDQFTKKLLFYWYIWYFLATLEALKHFYFIPNKKYGSFLKFWAPFQLHTTKARSCGFSQRLQRNQISETSGASWCISPKSDFFANFARSHMSDILSYDAGKELKISGKIHTFRSELNKSFWKFLKWSWNTKCITKILTSHTFW